MFHDFERTNNQTSETQILRWRFCLNCQKGRSLQERVKQSSTDQVFEVENLPPITNLQFTLSIIDANGEKIEGQIFATRVTAFTCREK